MADAGLKARPGMVRDDVEYLAKTLDWAKCIRANPERETASLLLADALIEMTEAQLAIAQEQRDRCGIPDVLPMRTVGERILTATERQLVEPILP